MRLLDDAPLLIQFNGPCLCVQREPVFEPEALNARAAARLRCIPGEQGTRLLPHRWLSAEEIKNSTLGGPHLHQLKRLVPRMRHQCARADAYGNQCTYAQQNNRGQACSPPHANASNGCTHGMFGGGVDCRSASIRPADIGPPCAGQANRIGLHNSLTSESQYRLPALLKLLAPTFNLSANLSGKRGICQLYCSDQSINLFIDLWLCRVTKQHVDQLSLRGTIGALGG